MTIKIASVGTLVSIPLRIQKDTNLLVYRTDVKRGEGVEILASPTLRCVRHALTSTSKEPSILAALVAGAFGIE